MNITVETSILLEMSNALWIHMPKLINRKPENFNKDILHNKLLIIQPVATKKGRSNSNAGLEKEKDPDWQSMIKTNTARDYLLARVWSPYMLEIARKQSVTHNFVLRHRFLERSKDVTFCKVCKAPITFSMAEDGGGEQSGQQLVKKWRPTFSSRDPHIDKHLQNEKVQKAFDNLEKICTKNECDSFNSVDWMSLRSELEDEQKKAKDRRQRAGNRHAGQELELMSQIDAAKVSTTDLARVVAVKITHFDRHIRRQLKDRKRQYEYLKAAKDNIQAVKIAQQRYNDELKQKIESFKKVVIASQQVSLPGVFKSKAEEINMPLRFHQVNRMMVRQMASMKKVNPSTNEPLRPYGQYSLFHLRGKEVVAWVGQSLKPKEHKNIFFVFLGCDTRNDQSGDGCKAEWRVEVNHRENMRTHVLFEFNINREDINQMRGAGKTARQHFHKSTVVMNAFQLLQLLARIVADSQLNDPPPI